MTLEMDEGDLILFGGAALLALWWMSGSANASTQNQGGQYSGYGQSGSYGQAQNGGYTGQGYYPNQGYNPGNYHTLAPVSPPGTIVTTTPTQPGEPVLNPPQPGSGPLGPRNYPGYITRDPQRISLGPPAKNTPYYPRATYTPPGHYTVTGSAPPPQTVGEPVSYAGESGGAYGGAYGTAYQGDTGAGTVYGSSGTPYRFGKPEDT